MQEDGAVHEGSQGGRCPVLVDRAGYVRREALMASGACHIAMPYAANVNRSAGAGQTHHRIDVEVRCL